MNKNEINILKFLHEAEKLKSVLRHNWLSSGRRESVAEHTWRMALMAMVFYTKLNNRVDLLKTLKIILVHDLAEIYAGDDWAWQNKKTDKFKREKAGFKKIIKHLNGKQRTDFFRLWEEYDIQKSPESKFAKALDKLEVIVQHMEGPINRMKKKEFKFNLGYGVKQSAHEPALKAFQAFLDKEWIRHYKKHKVNPSLYKIKI